MSFVNNIHVNKALRMTLAFSLSFLLLFLAGCGSTGGEEVKSSEPFIRIDRDDPAAADRDLQRLRLLTEGQYQYSDPAEKYDIDPDYVADDTGLDTLNISGSAQFSVRQFHELADTLRTLAKGKEIYIFDLRRESHAFLNGISFSVYADHNWTNEGMTEEEIMAEEDKYFSSLVGKEIQAFSKDDWPENGVTYQIDSWMSEKDLVESEGFHYIRLAEKDCYWPSVENIEDFVDFVRSVDMDNVWLHFHCSAGKGRTSAHMSMYDKMKNPEVDTQDIFIRQARLGGAYPLFIDEPDSYKFEATVEKTKLAPLTCQYIEEEGPEYETSWGEWLKRNGM